MSYCTECGQKLIDGTKYCQRCGTAVQKNTYSNYKGTQSENESADIRCPNCGRVINSFTRNCTACGFELRNIGTSSAVREFTLCFTITY